MKLNHKIVGNSASKRHACRRGFSMLDLLVAFTLLVAAVSISTQLVVRHAQLLKSQRNYRLALDELTNQLDRLSALTPADLPAAIQSIAPSEFVTKLLPNARLSGKLAEITGGAQVSLDITWDEMGYRRKPLTLAAWVFDSSPNAAEASGATQP